MNTERTYRTAQGCNVTEIRTRNEVHDREDVEIVLATPHVELALVSDRDAGRAWPQRKAASLDDLIGIRGVR